MSMFKRTSNKLLHLTQRSTFLFVHSLALIVAQKSTTTAAQMSKALYEGSVKLITLNIFALIIVGCAAQKEVDIPEAWVEKEVSIEYVHEHFYSLCKNIQQRSVYINGDPQKINRKCEKGSGNPFKTELEEPYQIFFARSPIETWKSLTGWAGCTGQAKPDTFF